MAKILKKHLRSSSTIWLIGLTKDSLPAVIPTYQDLLLRFFYEHENNNKNILKSILIIYKELFQLFEFLHLPIPDKSNFVRCIKNIFNKYNLVKKNRKTNTAIQNQKEKDFLSAINREYFVTTKSSEKLSIEEEILSESGGDSSEDSGIFHIVFDIFIKQLIV